MRTRSITLIAAGALLALPAVSMAKLVGVCSDCHTMHNSSAGAPMAYTKNKITGASTPNPNPNAVLLVTDCMGCHATGGANAIATFGAGSQIPQVYHTEAAKDLAGGNFAYIDGTKGGAASQRKGHNVRDLGLTAAELQLSSPPGFNVTTLHAGRFTTADFTCAGARGCHGNRNQTFADGTTKKVGLSALTGAHHYNVDGRIDGTIAGADATDVNNSYRFLRGVYGRETNLATGRWEYDYVAGGNLHNDYFASDWATNGWSGSIPEVGDGSGATPENCGVCHQGGQEQASATTNITAPTNSMSGFCATCHGVFHQDTNANGSFVRHPTDYQLPDKTEYQAYTIYDNTAPVGRTNLTITDNNVVNPGGNSSVMCLSCHKAHGSPYAGMLRFNYATMIAGGATAPANTTGGCFACHTTKDTGTKEGLW